MLGGRAPPATSITWLVTNDASGETKNRIMAAMSAALPGAPEGDAGDDAVVQRLRHARAEELGIGRVAGYDHVRGDPLRRVLGGESKHPGVQRSLSGDVGAAATAAA